MPEVRVHLAPMPPLLRAMVRDLIGDETTVKLVGASNPTGTLTAARAAQADVVVVHERSTGEDACLKALLDRRPFSIIAIDDGGAAARLDVRWLKFTDARKLRLVDAIRNASLRPGPGKADPTWR